MTDLVGGVDFWGPSWGLGERAGFWGVKGDCGCGARGEVEGLRPGPGTGRVPRTRSWGWGSFSIVNRQIHITAILLDTK